MSKKFYQRKSIRLREFDYSSPGYYSITICTKGSEYIFGEIILKQMYPSIGGNMVIQCWNQIPDHYPGVKIHQFQLMPNHIHGIIEITSNIHARPSVLLSGKTHDGHAGRAQNVEPLHSAMEDSNIHTHGASERAQNVEPLHFSMEDSNIQTHGASGRAQNVEPLHFSMEDSLKNRRKNEFQHIIPRSLGSIVKGFKIGVTNWFRENTQHQDVWQRNYFDRILKSEQDIIRTTRYIQNNPKYWVHDRFFRK